MYQVSVLVLIMPCRRPYKYLPHGLTFAFASSNLPVANKFSSQFLLMICPNNCHCLRSVINLRFVICATMKSSIYSWYIVWQKHWSALAIANDILGVPSVFNSLCSWLLKVVNETSHCEGVTIIAAWTADAE